MKTNPVKTLVLDRLRYYGITKMEQFKHFKDHMERKDNPVDTWTLTSQDYDIYTDNGAWKVPKHTIFIKEKRISYNTRGYTPIAMVLKDFPHNTEARIEEFWIQLMEYLESNKEED
ncbi:MAG: hypothetical protein HRT74_07695 [Flavobacteriales bacterium]|nr:hypothetical protein [Flavobacteriales bacterium]